jgi:prepilin-type processing-associated H-X9-DG protein
MLRQVNDTDIRNPQNVILLAEFSDSANCIYGSSVAGGAAYKSHRPTNAFQQMTSTDAGVTWGTATYFDGEAYSKAVQTGTIYKFQKMTNDECLNVINSVAADTTNTLAAKTDHISYINPNAHKEGSNYLFVDGHAARLTFDKTVATGNYMWGERVYSIVNMPTIQDHP